MAPKDSAPQVSPLSGLMRTMSMALSSAMNMRGVLGQLRGRGGGPAQEAGVTKTEGHHNTAPRRHRANGLPATVAWRYVPNLMALPRPGTTPSKLGSWSTNNGSHLRPPSIEGSLAQGHVDEYVDPWPHEE